MVPNQLPKSAPPNKGWHYFLTTMLTTAFTAMFVSSVVMTYNNWRIYYLLQDQRQRQQLNQAYWQQLNQAEKAAASQDFLYCLQQLPDVPTDSLFHSRAQQLQLRCARPVSENWLVQAEALAAEGKFSLAIETANQIEDGPLSAGSQQQIKLWSLRIIDLATERYVGGTDELEAAIEMLEKIPKESLAYDESQGLIDQWQKEWSANKRYLKSANLALENGDLERAASAAGQISTHPFWVPHRNQVWANIQQKEQSFEQLVLRAERLIAEGNLSEASAIANQLPDHAPWVDKKQVLLDQVHAIEKDFNRLHLFLAVMVVLSLCITIKPVSAKK